MAREKKRDLSERIIDKMREIRESADPWDEEQTLRRQARAAQEEAASLVTDIAQSLSDICIRAGHRGSVKAGPSSPSLPCMRCRTKIKHYRDIADLIATT